MKTYCEIIMCNNHTHTTIEFLNRIGQKLWINSTYTKCTVWTVDLAETSMIVLYECTLF